VSANTWPWAEKEAQLKKLQEEFVQAVNRYVFRTGARALEGLEEDGAGELLDGRSEQVKDAITGLFQPLLPPPPRIVDVVRPQTLLPSSPAAGSFWHPAQQIQQPHPQPVESWKVLPSTPSPTLASCTSETQPTFWSTMGLNDIQLPSPTPSYSQPFTTSQYYSPPQAVATVASLPVSNSSIIAQQCSAAVSAPGFGPFDWSSTAFAPNYATAI
jgi:hypothetical protein